MKDKYMPITIPKTVFRGKYMSIDLKRLEWYRIILPGDDLLHNTGSMLIFSLATKIPG